MATKLVTLTLDERYPDFDIEEVDEFISSFSRRIEIDEKLYKELKEVCDKYNEVQGKLSKLYAKAKQKADS